jgi:glycosyltransferase involved in cell wall biosynthesis
LIGHSSAAANAKPGKLSVADGGPDTADGPDTAGDRPVRVAIVIARLEGGAGMLALHGAKVLDPEAATVTIIAGNGQRLLADAVAAGLEVIIEPSLRAPIDPARDALAFRRLERLFRDRNFDVVHTHCAKAGAIGRVAAYRTGTPQIVHTYHGFAFHQFQSKARRQAYVAIERRLGRYTHLALCVGAGVAAEAVRRRLIAPERIRTIGVAVKDAAATAASMSAARPEARRHARMALGLPADAPVVGVVGRLTYQKAPEDFIAAMQALRRPDVIGVWIGDGELAERINCLAQAANGTRIVLAGERSDVLDVLPALDVFVLPSRYEGLPTAIVEAMICGVPVIATAVNAVPDLVIPGETGLLVPPGRTDLLAAAVSHLLDAPAVARRMAVAARAHVGDRYSEPALRDALTAAYALSRGSQPSPTAAPLSRAPGWAGGCPATGRHAGRA